MSLEMKMDSYLRKVNRRLELKVYTCSNVVYVKFIVVKMYSLFHIFM